MRDPRVKVRCGLGGERLVAFGGDEHHVLSCVFGRHEFSDAHTVPLAFEQQRAQGIGGHLCLPLGE